MTNYMIKATNPTTNQSVYLGVPEFNLNNMKNLLDEYSAKYEVYSVDSMPLEALPEEIQMKVKNTLKAFDKVNVEFESGKFSASVGCCIKSSYGYDHFVCGTYRADEVYTKEERRQNYIEEFGYDGFR